MDTCRRAELQIQRWAFPAAAVRGLAGVWNLFRLCVQVQRERAQLLALDDRMLKDIGLSRAGALQEGRRPFGDVDLRRAHRAGRR